MSGSNHIIRLLIINIEVDMVCTFTSIYYIYIYCIILYTYKPETSSGVFSTSLMVRLLCSLQVYACLRAQIPFSYSVASATKPMTLITNERNHFEVNNEKNTWLVRIYRGLCVGIIS